MNPDKHHIIQSNEIFHVTDENFEEIAKALGLVK